MIKLFFYGEMAKAYGQSIELHADTPREAVTALGYQIPAYRKYLEERDWHIILGDDNEIEEAALDMSLGTFQEVHLMPVIQGSGKATSFIAGAVLFVAGAVMSAFDYGTISSNLMWMGGAMMLGGLVQMTTKIPKAENIATEEEDKRASFLFNGAINSSTQGSVIPYGYGRMLAGSVVISGSVYAEQLKA